MPTIETKKAQAVCQDIEVIIKLKFPPKTLEDGSVTYGKIEHIESKGVDVDGNVAGNVYWFHDEIRNSLKSKLVGVLLSEVDETLAEANITVDLTPTPFEPPVVEEVADGEGEG